MEKERALIIADSPDRRNFLEYHLRSNELHPVWYPNIMSSRMAVKADSFSIVIVDLSIPVEPKLTLIKECMKNRPDTQIVCIGKIEYLQKEKPFPEQSSIVTLASVESMPVFLGEWKKEARH